MLGCLRVKSPRVEKEGMTVWRVGVRKGGDAKGVVGEFRMNVLGAFG